MVVFVVDRGYVFIEHTDNIAIFFFGNFIEDFVVLDQGNSVVSTKYFYLIKGIVSYRLRMDIHHLDFVGLFDKKFDCQSRPKGI